MLTSFDFAVVAVYLVFLVAVGWYFRHAGSDSSEYFRGGGRMTWWMVAASSFMGSFSAWTFTGAAGLAYDHGIVVLLLYWGNALGFGLNWAYFAAWSRNTRLITALEGVRRRLGAGNEQVFMWLQVPFLIVQAGIWLYGLAILCTPVFGYSLPTTILVGGFVVVFVAAVGGSWAVVAGDFIQALVLVPVTLVAAVAAVRAAGGPASLAGALPASHGDLLAAAQGFGPWWLLAVVLEKVTNINGLHASSRYLCVRDGAAGRRAAALAAGLYVAGSVFWFLPPLAARALAIPLGSYPGIANPAEMSYIVMAARVLPAGLLGLLVTGVISTTMSAMDTGLNRNAGVFVRSFYLPVLRPRATEHELVLAGRATTWAFGLLAIAMALFYSSWREVGAFKLMMNFSALVATPYAVPLFWCLLVRRSPDWAAWTGLALSALVGAAVSLLPKTAWAHGLPPGAFADAVGCARDHEYVAITLANVTAGTAWFLGAAALTRGRPAPPARAAEITAFFQDIDREVTPAEAGAIDRPRHLGVARLCFLYGVFIAVLAALSPTWAGRLGLGFCAVFVLGTGAAIRRAMRAEPPSP